MYDIYIYMIYKYIYISYDIYVYGCVPAPSKGVPKMVPKQGLP